MHEAAVPVDENCLSPTLPAFRHAQQRSPGLCDAQWTLHGGGNAGRAETHGQTCAHPGRRRDQRTVPEALRGAVMAFVLHAATKA